MITRALLLNSLVFGLGLCCYAHIAAPYLSQLGFSQSSIIICSAFLAIWLYNIDLFDEG